MIHDTNDRSRSGPALDRQNPWLGLWSYAEEQSAWFHGREEETDHLASLVRGETLCLLYGVSGLGKTSLLQAGLFPRIRARGGLPFRVRLDLSATLSLAAQVRERLLEAALDIQAEAPVVRDDISLWEYFHLRDSDVWSPSNSRLIPVIVLDQFEEIFTRGRTTSEIQSRVQDFLVDLACLVENRVHPSVVRQLESDRSTAHRLHFEPAPVRLVLSLREDFLPDLEDIRTILRVPAANRLRLLPMTSEKGLQVIEKSGEEILEPGVAADILSLVAAARTENDRRSDAPFLPALSGSLIEPSMLSLVLYDLNVKRRSQNHQLITRALVQESTEFILDDFWNRSFSELPDSARAFVEECLVSPTGWRTRAALDEIEPYGLREADLDRLVNRRLVSYHEDRRGRYVELTHDVLIPKVLNSRRERRKREQLEREARREARIANSERLLLWLLKSLSPVLTLEDREELLGEVDLYYRGHEGDELKGTLRGRAELRYQQGRVAVSVGERSRALKQLDLAKGLWEQAGDIEGTTRADQLLIEAATLPEPEPDDEDHYYHLFVSYSRRDNAVGSITALVDRMREAYQLLTGGRLRVFYDASDIVAMGDWRQRSVTALRGAALLLVCISPAYLQSAYCEWEIREYLTYEAARGLMGEGILPVYLADVPGWLTWESTGNVPAWAAELRHRQFVDLREWHSRGDHTLADETTNHRFLQMIEAIWDRSERLRRRSVAGGNIPRHNPQFVGRRAELRRLRESMMLGKLGVLTIVNGLGGIGKTALAEEYAHVFAHEYPGGRWIVICEGREDLRAALVSLVGARDLVFELTEGEKQDLDRASQRVIWELKAHADAANPQRVLLILDNVDSPQLLEPARIGALPQAEWLSVLVTTRLGESELFDRPLDRRFIGLDELPEDDALDLIERYQPDGKLEGAERDAAREIVNLVGCFTLAVEMAAIFLGQYAGEITCVAYLDRLKTERLVGLAGAASRSAEGAPHGENSLTAALTSTLERLTPDQISALEYAALLPPDHIPFPWLKALVGQHYPGLLEPVDPGHPDPWQAIIRKLISLRLLQPGGEPNEARMHSLVQAVILDRARGKTEGLRQELIVLATARCQFLEYGWLELQGRWEIEPLRALAEGMIERQEREASWIANSIGLRLLDLARYADAEPLLRKSIQIDEERFGPDHPAVSGALTNLAQLLQDTDRLAEAEPLMRRAFEIDERSHGSDHPKVSTDLNNLALLLQDTNRLQEAEPLMRRALEIDEQSYGPHHPNVARDLNNLALLLQDTNRLQEAEPLMRRALEIDEQSYGPHHPNVAIRLNNLAGLLKATNRLQDAEPLMRRALEIDEQSYGPHHPEVARDLNNLAGLLQATNRLQDAEPLMRRALEIDEQSYGPHHPEVARDLNNLALLLQDTNRLQEAEPLMRRALEIFKTSLGPDHPNVATQLNNLALLLQATNRLQEAEPLMRRSLEIDEQSYGRHHPNVAIRLNNLASLLKATNRLQDAEPLMRRALEIDEQSYGPHHPEVATDLNNLAGLLQATNRLRDAEPLMRRHLVIFLDFTRATGHPHPHLQAAINNYAGLLSEVGMSQEQILAALRELAPEFFPQ